MSQLTATMVRKKMPRDNILTLPYVSPNNPDNGIIIAWKPEIQE
jgi:hypothetical protein